ncbi:MAG: AzlD domain-containing protein [Dehalococcoidia bacterium]
MTLWLVVAGAGVLTYGIRLSMLVFVSHDALPDAARNALRFVTPAILCAIILPNVLYLGDDDTLSAGIGNERLIAAVAAAAVSLIGRNVWLTIGTGMGVLWVLQWAT